MHLLMIEPSIDIALSVYCMYIVGEGEVEFELQTDITKDVIIYYY